jgi:hypothetical protein
MWIPSIWNGRKISHFLYMDNMRLLRRYKEEFIKEIRIVKTINNNIKMESEFLQNVARFKENNTTRKHNGE